jgi:chemotaxis protein MotB
VVRLFIENGVDPARLTAVGFADQRPVEPNDTNEGRTRNRRVTVMIEPDVKVPTIVLQ